MESESKTELVKWQKKISFSQLTVIKSFKLVNYGIVSNLLHYTYWNGCLNEFNWIVKKTEQQIVQFTDTTTNTLHFDKNMEYEWISGKKPNKILNISQKSVLCANVLYDLYPLGCRLAALWFFIVYEKWGKPKESMKNYCIY